MELGKGLVLGWGVPEEGSTDELWEQDERTTYRLHRPQELLNSEARSRNQASQRSSGHVAWLGTQSVAKWPCFVRMVWLPC